MSNAFTPTRSGRAYAPTSATTPSITPSASRPTRSSRKGQAIGSPTHNLSFEDSTRPSPTTPATTTASPFARSEKSARRLVPTDVLRVAVVQGSNLPFSQHKQTPPSCYVLLHMVDGEEMGSDR